MELATIGRTTIGLTRRDSGAGTKSEESREENNYNFTINLCNNFRDHGNLKL